METNNAYIEMSAVEGEQTEFVVVEDQHTILIRESFYHTTGFTFTARKGRQYTLRFTPLGSTKMVVMYVENFLSAGKTDHAISKDHVYTHQ